MGGARNTMGTGGNMGARSTVATAGARCDAAVAQVLNRPAAGAGRWLVATDTDTTNVEAGETAAAAAGKRGGKGKKREMRRVPERQYDSPCGEKKRSM